jgi:hypothetical protein
VKWISWRVQLAFITAGYAAVLMFAAELLYERHLEELRHPADVAAASGMYAGGDALLEIFIVCLFMVPTVFLVWVIARFEGLYKAYSQFLLAISLSAPFCLSVLALGGIYLADSIKIICLYRLLWSPFIVVAIGASRLAGRFNRAKKLVSYALFIEGLTLAIAVGMLINIGLRNV